jgi:hypothetical protein
VQASGNFCRAPFVINAKSLHISLIEWKPLQASARTIQQTLTERPESRSVRCKLAARGSGGEQATVRAEGDGQHRTSEDHPGASL